MPYDVRGEQSKRGLRNTKQLIKHLQLQQKTGYRIVFMTIRFQPSRFIYPVQTTNHLHQEHAWNDARNRVDIITQEWLENMYLSNTRSRKRSLDLGWEFIGRFERGYTNGFLHIHGFLAVYEGPKTAIRISFDETLKRIMESNYHGQISATHASALSDTIDNVTAYVFKQSRMPFIGDEFVFASTTNKTALNMQKRPAVYTRVTPNLYLD